MRRSLILLAFSAWLGGHAAALSAQTPVSVAEPQRAQSEETLRLTGNLSAR